MAVGQAPKAPSSNQPGNPGAPPGKQDVHIYHATSTDALLIVSEFLSLNKMKLPVLFKVFNSRGDGLLSETDVKEMLLSCNPSLSLRQLKRCMKQVKDQLDKSMEGRISISIQDMRLALQELQEDIATKCPWPRRPSTQATNELFIREQQVQQAVPQAQSGNQDLVPQEMIRAGQDSGTRSCALASSSSFEQAPVSQTSCIKATSRYPEIYGTPLTMPLMRQQKEHCDVQYPVIYQGYR